MFVDADDGVKVWGEEAGMYCQQSNLVRYESSWRTGYILADDGHKIMISPPHAWMGVYNNPGIRAEKNASGVYTTYLIADNGAKLEAGVARDVISRNTNGVQIAKHPITGNYTYYIIADDGERAWGKEVAWRAPYEQ